MTQGLEVIKHKEVFYYLVPNERDITDPFDQGCNGCDFWDGDGCIGEHGGPDCIRAEVVIVREQKQYDKEQE